MQIQAVGGKYEIRNSQDTVEPMQNNPKHETE